MYAQLIPGHKNLHVVKITLLAKDIFSLALANKKYFATYCSLKEVLDVLLADAQGSPPSRPKTLLLKLY